MTAACGDGHADNQGGDRERSARDSQDSGGSVRRISWHVRNERLDQGNAGERQARLPREGGPRGGVGRCGGGFGPLLDRGWRLRDPAAVRAPYPPGPRDRQGAAAGNRAAGRRRPQVLRLHDAPRVTEYRHVSESRLSPRIPTARPVPPRRLDLLLQISEALALTSRLSAVPPRRSAWRSGE